MSCFLPSHPRRTAPTEKSGPHFLHGHLRAPAALPAPFTARLAIPPVTDERDPVPCDAEADIQHAACKTLAVGDLHPRRGAGAGRVSRIFEHCCVRDL